MLFPMEIVYTNHAQIRIEQRELSKKQIEASIASPDQTLPSFKGRQLIRKQFDNKTLEVVYRKFSDKIVVITAYWLKEV